MPATVSTVWSCCRAQLAAHLKAWLQYALHQLVSDSAFVAVGLQ